MFLIRLHFTKIEMLLPSFRGMQCSYPRYRLTMSSNLSSYMSRPSIPSLTQFPELLGSYKRGRVGHCKFVWTAAELELVSLGFRQFHSSQDDVVQHLHDLIRSCVKTSVISQAMTECEKAAFLHNNPNLRFNFSSFSRKLHASFQDQFDSIAPRWIRFPSLAAVRCKLRQCAILATMPHTILTRVFSVSKLHQQTFQMIHHRAESIRHSDAPCHFYDLPCVPTDHQLYQFGHCFRCGTGLDWESDINFAHLCTCETAQHEQYDICVCNDCADNSTCCNACCDKCCRCTCQYCYQGIHHNY
jgi:hypothetical protein